MQSLRSIVLLLVIFTCFARGLHADVISEDFFLGLADGVAAVDDTFSFSRMFLADDGVSFTATLNIVGSNDFNQTNTTGIGVVGNSNNLFNGDEFAEFSLQLTNIIGGVVIFDGFSEIDLSSIDSTELAAISSDGLFDDGDTTLTGNDSGDVFALDDLTSFFVVSNGQAANTFRVTGVTANFTTTAAVPEPSTWAMTGLLLGGFAWRRRQLSSSVKSLQ